MMNLAEYRRSSTCLADFLPWAALVAPGVVLNKDGSFQRSARFRGPDLDSAVQAELVAVAGRLNSAFRRLGSGWAIFVEAQRHAVGAYPASRFPDAASAMVDAERKADFEEDAVHYESSYFLTFTFLPPAEDAARAESWLYEGKAERGVDAWEALYRAQVAVMRRLNAEFPDDEVSLTEYDVVFNLYRQPGRAARIRDLNRLLLLSQPSVSRLLDRLVARGIVLKDSVAADLTTAMRAVLSGDYWIGGERVMNLVAALNDLMKQAAATPERKTYGLTPRELDVVTCIVEGCSNKDVAKQFAISEETVKRHLSNIFDKTGVSTRLELALFAIAHKLVKLEA